MKISTPQNHKIILQEIIFSTLFFIFHLKFKKCYVKHWTLKMRWKRVEIWNIPLGPRVCEPVLLCDAMFTADEKVCDLIRIHLTSSFLCLYIIIKEFYGLKIMIASKRELFYRFYEATTYHNASKIFMSGNFIGSCRSLF